MHFPPLIILLGLAVSSLAAPTALGVLTEQTYDQISVSSGVSGNADAEVLAKFPVDTKNLALVAASDLLIITKAAQISEQAEVATGGFNDAIAAAGGENTVAGKALQNGKIKNKVLKLQTDVLRIQIEVAQGNTKSASELQTQQTKLNNNIALDVAANGQQSTAINFVASD